ncbi:MAG: hypothetical protein ACTXOO_01545 [Sodalis sp. (in: enterobacteria)]
MRLALAFIDYMKTQGVEIKLRSQGALCGLWLAKDEKTEQVQVALDMFVLDRSIPVIQLLAGAPVCCITTAKRCLAFVPGCCCVNRSAP